MSTACECGMTLEPRSATARCGECGIAGCGSCAVVIDARVYCRWCAVTLAPASTQGEVWR